MTDELWKAAVLQFASHVALVSAKYMANRLTKGEMDVEMLQLTNSFLEKWKGIRITEPLRQQEH